MRMRQIERAIAKFRYRERTDAIVFLKSISEGDGEPPAGVVDMVVETRWEEAVYLEAIQRVKNLQAGKRSTTWFEILLTMWVISNAGKSFTDCPALGGGKARGFIIEEARHKPPFVL